MAGLSPADRFGALSSEQRVRFMRRLVEAGRAGSVPAVVPVRDTDGPVRLGPAQEDLWVYDSLYPGTPALNLCSAYHFEGPVDPGHLAAALTVVQEHHDILRARIRGRAGDLWLDFPDEGPFALEREDLRGTGRGVAEAFEAFRRRPFDLARDRLVRARFVTVDEERSTLMLSLHHIITDWWSFDVLQSEFAEAYRAVRDGVAPRTARPRVQYADFAAWQGELEAAGVFEARLDFWRRYLGRPPGPLTVPGAPSAEPGIAQVPFLVDPATARAVRALARERGASVYVVLMAAFAVLAHRLSGAGDLVLGTPTANRAAKGLERVIGYVMNAVPTRWRIRPEESFGQVLGRFVADFPDVMANADVPVGRIVSAAAPERSAGRSPLFQWVFMHLAQQRSVRALRDFAVPERIHTGGEHDLVGIVRDAEDPDGGMTGSFEVRTELFAPAAVARWAEAYVELLRRVTADPDAPVGGHDLVPAGERARLLAASAGPAGPEPAALPDLVARWAARTPGAPALAGAGSPALSYAELADRVDRLAGLLAARGAGPGQVVAVALGRSPDAVVAALAVQRAGAAHLPVDPDHPAERVAYVLGDAAPVLVVTAPGGARLPGDVPRLVLDGSAYAHEPLAARRPARPDDTAYVIHTSGTTGRPKGVVVPHRGIAALGHSLAERFGLGPSDRVLHLGSPAFDISVGEAAMAFAAGATLVVAPPVPLAGAALGDVLAAERVTCTLLPPSVLATVPEGDFPDLRVVAVGAEACPPELVARWAVRGRRFHNAYGPTESTVATTASGPLAPDGAGAPGAGSAGVTTIGTPVAGTRAYVLDARLRPVPAGVRGELYLAGDGLALGYLNRPGATAGRFVADPYGPPGARMYRTGDLARWREDGSLDFLGRADDQVQVRGFRVEPGEVAAVLAGHPRVRQAVVVVRGGRLLGYVVLEGPADAGELIAHAARRLPAHMVPSDMVVLDALPLGPGGKVDRAALPDPAGAAPGSGRAPASGREEVLCGLFADVLGVAPVGADDDFFRRGGDSIMAIQLAGRALTEAGLSLTPRDVFTARTPAGLARVASAVAPEAAGAAAAGAGASGAGADSGCLPLTPIMHWWREQGGDPAAFTQSMAFPVPDGTPFERVTAAVQGLVDRHGALRMRLTGDELEVRPAGDVVAEVLRSAPADPRLDPSRGGMLRAVLEDGRLLVTVHHLAVDGVSWRVLGPELAAALAGGPVPAPGGTPFRRWAGLLRQEAARPERVDAEPAWWERALAGPDARVAGGRGAGAERRTVTVTLPAEVTEAVLGTVPAAFHCGTDAVLLTALTAAVERWRGAGSGLLVHLEGHGREFLARDVDVSRTVGWFTTQYPVRLDAGQAGGDAFWEPSAAAPGEALKRVKEQLRAVPDGGLGWGLLRYLNPDTAPKLAALPVPDVRFNYLGRLAAGDAGGGELLGAAAGAVPLGHALEIDAVVGDEGLVAGWSYAGGVLDEERVRRLAELWRAAVGVLVAHTGHEGAGGHTASDFDLVDLSQEQLAMLEGDW
ncbi:non-ribosomal peptide synthetase [Streptomyces sp. NRRL S-118]|uniref:non-ribosomal peptide synthetase n=1 Tax=Streptomyces sp. NRRL S-118 TaxID=1463881 RepID=UPI000694A436|nr:non-ribosomal peptide synthetase [Streptomyces sp. NRRL S-118]